MRVAKPGVELSGPDTQLEFEGGVVPARRDESVAAALVAAGHYACRTSRRGSPRGVFCGMGVCSECAVTLDGVAGRLACLERVGESTRVERNPAQRPLTDEPDSGPPPPAEEAVGCDVLVVGGGPAGLAAALAAAGAGAGVVLVDERSGPGGQFFKQPAFAVEEGRLDRQYARGRALARQVAEAGVRVVRGARVWGHDGPRQLYAAGHGARYSLTCRALVLATGAFERASPFPGWTLPGVMTTGAAQTLLRSYLVAAGERVLIAGNGPLNLQVAAELAAAGVEVVAVAELAPLRSPARLGALARMAAAGPAHLADGAGYLARLSRAGVRVLTSTTVVEVSGEQRVEEATLAPVGSDGRPGPERRRIAVDAVCLGFGFVPSSELARSLGCEHDLDPASATLVVRRDRAGRSSLAGVWVAGDGGRIAGAEVALAGGTLAGLDAARSLGLAPGPSALAEERRARRRLRRELAFQSALWRLYAAPQLGTRLASAETVICRCEDVTLAELEQASAPYLAAAGSLKRLTRAGMGKCQGRYCSPSVVALAGVAGGTAPGPLSGFLPQPPLVPVPVSELAGPPER